MFESPLGWEPEIGPKNRNTDVFRYPTVTRWKPKIRDRNLLMDVFRYPTVTRSCFEFLVTRP
jgi:hypothetical protein